MYNENKECKIDGDIFKIDIKTHLQLDIDLDEIRKRIINSDYDEDEMYVYDIIDDYLDELEDYDDEKFDLEEDVHMALYENGYLDDLNSKSEEENELETLKKENARLKQQLSESHDHGWDFHWDGKGSYEESYRTFYGSFS